MVALGLHKEMLGWLSLEVALVCLDRMLPSEDEGEENLCFIGGFMFYWKIYVLLENFFF
jgi:hypothetical protein